MKVFLFLVKYLKIEDKTIKNRKISTEIQHLCSNILKESGKYSSHKLFFREIIPMKFYLKSIFFD